MSTFSFRNLKAASDAATVPLAGVSMRNEGIVRVFHDTINLLGASLAAARRQDKVPPEKLAQFEMIFGYAMLALNEARALWSLVSCGLELQAMVHLRTIAEHASRISLLLSDPDQATKLYDSLGASERDLLEDLSLKPDVKKALEEKFAPLVEAKPDRKALPTMRELLKSTKLGAFDYGTYRTLSQTAHGSVVALRNIAKATSERDADFIDVSSRDGSGEYQFRQATYLLLAIISGVAFVSGADIDEEFLRIAESLGKHLGADTAT